MQEKKLSTQDNFTKKIKIHTMIQNMQNSVSKGSDKHV